MKTEDKGEKEAQKPEAAPEDSERHNTDSSPHKVHPLFDFDTYGDDQFK